jgi:hypothetical protein
MRGRKLIKPKTGTKKSKFLLAKQKMLEYSSYNYEFTLHEVARVQPRAGAWGEEPRNSPPSLEREIVEKPRRNLSRQQLRFFLTSTIQSAWITAAKNGGTARSLHQSPWQPKPKPRGIRISRREISLSAKERKHQACARACGRGTPKWKRRGFHASKPRRAAQKRVSRQASTQSKKPMEGIKRKEEEAGGGY